VVKAKTRGTVLVLPSDTDKIIRFAKILKAREVVVRKLPVGSFTNSDLG
jgi:hypothetical protein